MIDFADDVSYGPRIGGVSQHVQNRVDVVARDFAFLLRVERVESFSQN